MLIPPYDSTFYLTHLLPKCRILLAVIREPLPYLTHSGRNGLLSYLYNALYSNTLVPSTLFIHTFAKMASQLPFLNSLMLPSEPYDSQQRTLLLLSTTNLDFNMTGQLTTWLENLLQ